MRQPPKTLSWISRFAGPFAIAALVLLGGAIEAQAAKLAVAQRRAILVADGMFSMGKPKVVNNRVFRGATTQGYLGIVAYGQQLKNSNSLFDELRLRHLPSPKDALFSVFGEGQLKFVRKADGLLDVHWVGENNNSRRLGEIRRTAPSSEFKNGQEYFMPATQARRAVASILGSNVASALGRYRTDVSGSTARDQDGERVNKFTRIIGRGGRYRERESWRWFNSDALSSWWSSNGDRGTPSAADIARETAYNSSWLRMMMRPATELRTKDIQDVVGGGLFAAQEGVITKANKAQRVAFAYSTGVTGRSKKTAKARIRVVLDGSTIESPSVETIGFVYNGKAPQAWRQQQLAGRQAKAWDRFVRRQRARKSTENERRVAKDLFRIAELDPKTGAPTAKSTSVTLTLNSQGGFAPNERIASLFGERGRLMFGKANAVGEVEVYFAPQDKPRVAIGKIAGKTRARRFIPTAGLLNRLHQRAGESIISRASEKVRMYRNVYKVSSELGADATYEVVEGRNQRVREPSSATRHYVGVPGFYILQDIRSHFRNKLEHPLVSQGSNAKGDHKPMVISWRTQTLPESGKTLPAGKVVEHIVVLSNNTVQFSDRFDAVKGISAGKPSPLMQQMLIHLTGSYGGQLSFGQQTISHHYRIVDSVER